jgi:hypothetical protein
MILDIRGWIADTSSDIRSDPYTVKHALLKSGLLLYDGLYQTVSSRFPLGENVFDREWDLLVILDACRLDALRTVSAEYDFIHDVNGMWSVGSSSHEWTVKTFTTNYLSEIQKTGYISANPFSERTFSDGIYPPYENSVPISFPRWDVVDETDFGYFHDATTFDHDDRFEAVPPEYLTQKAIQVGRQRDLDRVIVHYFQPHRPYIYEAVRNGGELTAEHDEPLKTFAQGEISRDLLWEMYLDNLRFVLDSVATLAQNFDAEKAIISADHGEGMGELWVYGHPEAVPHPKVKKVPWAEMDAADTAQVEPAIETEESTADAEDRLRALGYL